MKIFYTKNKVNSRAFLDFVLKEYCGVTNVQITVGEHGKPRLATDGLFFNLSHSGNVTAVAVGECEVGLDLQRRTNRGYPATLKRMAPTEREEDFFRVWTAKEAYVKYLGSSLAAEYSALRFANGMLYQDEKPANVSLLFYETESYVLCLCTELPCSAVEFEEVRL